MDASVYEKIETEIKTKDYYMRESFLNSVVYIALCIVLPMNVWLVVLYKYIGWIVLVSEILLFAFIMHIIKFKLVYQISRLHNLNNEDPESTVKRSEIFNLKKVDLIAKKLKTCKPNMLEILKQFGITTKDGLEEAIEHYRFKLNNSAHISVNFLALFTSGVSIISFFLNYENIQMNFSKIIVIIILILIFIVYLLVLYIYRTIFYKYSKNAFYSRIENALSEIRALNKLTTRGRKKKEDRALSNITDIK